MTPHTPTRRRTGPVALSCTIALTALVGATACSASFGTDGASKSASTSGTHGGTSNSGISSGLPATTKPVTPHSTSPSTKASTSGVTSSGSASATTGPSGSGGDKTSFHPQGDPSKNWITGATARTIALAGQHPDLSVCNGIAAVNAASSVGPDGQQYWAVASTCKGATGSSPEDITIVAPTGDNHGGSYVAAQSEKHQGYDLLVDSFTVKGTQLTVNFAEASITVKHGNKQHLFTQTDTMHVNSVSKGPMIATGTRNPS